MKLDANIILIIIFVVAAIFIGLYYLNRWALKKMDTQQGLIEKNKQTVSIFVIDKKRSKPADSNLPKNVIEQLPKMYRFMKLNLVKAKIGPQILTLMCDKKVYDVIPVKKTIKVDLAGMYIVSVKGMKTADELKKIKKEKKAKEKAEKKK